MPNIFTKMQDKLKGVPPSAAPLRVEDKIKEALKSVMDPDLHKDIVTLGFVKKITVTDGKADLLVELTTPACPAKDMLKKQIEEKTLLVPGVTSVAVDFSARVPRGGAAKGAEVQAALGQVANIIAVASGKGGVGKSTTTVNLALALAQAGSKVGILDADIHGPSIPMMTGVAQPTEQEGKMVVPPMAYGMKIISVEMFTPDGKANIMRGPMTSQIVKQFLTQIAWGELDYLLIDYPPGTGDIQLSLSQIAPLSGAVIVTTPQDVALLDARKAVTMFNTTKVPILGVVETMSYFVCDGCDKQHAIFKEGGGEKVALEHGVPLLSKIPLLPSVAEASDSGKPAVLSDTPAAKAYKEAASTLASQLSIINMNAAGLTEFSLDWQ